MSNLTQRPDDWLTDQFEYEYCAECGGDAIHHTAIPFLGNWFARCDYPMPTDGASDLPHPVILAYREKQGDFFPRPGCPKDCYRNERHVVGCPYGPEPTGLD